MNTPFSGVPADRRTFLTLLAAGAAVTASGGLLEACSKTTGGKGNAEQANKLADLLPKFKAYTSVTPDIPGENGAPNGFLKYPRNLVRAVPNVRGKGTTFTAMTPLWGTPPPSSNPYYSAIAARTGSPVKFNTIDGNTYDQKLTAVLGSGDVPDVVNIPGWLTGLPRMSEAVENLFADLTPLLKGDISAQWPRLANLPTEAWQLCVWGGKLKAIPVTTGIFTNYGIYRKDLFDQLGVVPPKNADELHQLGKKITDPSKNRWAFSDLWDNGGGMVPAMFKSPGRKHWKKDSSGKMVINLETQEFKDGVAFMRMLFDEKLVHPAVAAGSFDGKQLFESGQMLITNDGLGGITEAYARQVKTNPNFRMQPLPVISHDGGTPIYYGSDAAGFYVFLNKKLSQDKLKEYLDLADWLAAPFGTEENQLMAYGVEGTHFNRQANGTLAYTDEGTKEASLPTYYFLAGRPSVISESQYPDYVQSMAAWGNQAAKYIDKDMFAGIRVEEPAALQSANKPVNDKINDILRGRQPLSYLQTVINDWRSSGGEEGRKFYEKIVKDNNL